MRRRNVNGARRRNELPTEGTRSVIPERLANIFHGSKYHRMYLRGLESGLPYLGYQTCMISDYLRTAMHGYDKNYCSNVLYSYVGEKAVSSSCFVDHIDPLEYIRGWLKFILMLRPRLDVGYRRAVRRSTFSKSVQTIAYKNRLKWYLRDAVPDWGVKMRS
jgi:hypothetical protein